MMGIKDENIIQMGLLNESESTKLFNHHIGEGIDEVDYKPMARKLLNKCGGLPLTIVATANVLKGKDLSMWRYFSDELEKSISSQVIRVRRETYAILETSYKVMESDEKKMFFLLVCLSPLGSSISIENLMRYGVGLGLFQHVNKLSEALEQTSTWITELISSSLLLEGDSQYQVKIHDDVRVSANSFATKENHEFLVDTIPRWMCKESFNKYTAISSLSGYDFSCLNGVKAEKLQILLLKGNLCHTLELADCFFQGMTNLKVLHLSYMNLEPKLPKSIGELKKLKTLHLEHCKLGDISLICELIELIVVSLCDSVLERLPVKMGKLVNLRMLDMSGCKINSPTDSNVIASLSSLEGLYLFDNFKEWAATTPKSKDSGETSKMKSITEFHELRHLNLLEVDVYEPMHLPLGLISKNLDNFLIRVGIFKRTKRPLQRRALELISKQDISCLEVLLKRADYLRLRDTKLKNSLVPELDKEGFKDLKYLELSSCTGVESVISTDRLNDLTAFQNLDYLKLSSIDDLKMICEGEAPPGLFSNLRYLELFNLNLEYALPLALLPRNLTEINIEQCDSLKFIFNENECVPSDGGESGEHKEKDVIDLPRLRLVKINGAIDLVSMLGTAAKFSNPEDGLIGQSFFNKKIMCPTLERLHLEQCYKIKSIWRKELDMSSFQNLNDLSIIYCRNLQSLGSASVFSALVQLRSLAVVGCDRMHEVINKETQEFEIPQTTITFRQLRELFLYDMRNLEIFYGGSYKVEFPKLKKLILHHLPELTAFVVSKDPTTLFSDKVEFPYLEELEILDVIKDTHKQLWYRDPSVVKDAPKLREVTIDSIKGLRLIPNIISSLQLYDINGVSTDKVLFSNSSQPPKLKLLCIKFFKRLENLFENEDNGTTTSAGMLMFYGQLKQLELQTLPELKLLPLRLFKNLGSLHISYLKWKYVFPSGDVVRSLEMLQEVDILGCEQMDVIVQDEVEGGSNDRVVVFPRLKTLKLATSSIQSFISRPDAALHLPSLETLTIIDCCNLEAFWSGPLVAPKLKQVEVIHCNEMKWLLSRNPSQVVELLCLQRVEIRGVHNMQSFCAIPLKAPNLREVVLRYCNNMEWFLPGYPNRDDLLELPSLEILEINNSNLQTFSPGPLSAPKLTQVTFQNKDYSIQEIHNSNDFLRDHYQKKVWKKALNPRRTFLLYLCSFVKDIMRVLKCWFKIPQISKLKGD